MQERHVNREQYFMELGNTSREYYIDYLLKHFDLNKGTKVLEIGCGDGGNLLPFAEVGCQITGIDRSEARIFQAKATFQSLGFKSDFIAIDFLDFGNCKREERYDIILIHDVIEHIAQKDKFIKHVKGFLAPGGIVFWRFPAWQMPFGGHQQICKHKVCSKLPFIHLLPNPLYRRLLTSFGESQPTIDELMDIKSCRTTIEKFEKLIKLNEYTIVDRCLWFINPHYKQKFNLNPRKLSKLIVPVRYIRNFFTTSCYYLTQ